MSLADMDEGPFFAELERNNVRALLIGRRALIALGIPVLTADYDFWAHIDDIEKLNQVAEGFELYPNRTPTEARQHGRYVLENDDHVDVMIARAATTITGSRVVFEELWTRRERLMTAPNIYVCVPSIDDLMETKLLGGREKDLSDIRLLEALKKELL